MQIDENEGEAEDKEDIKQEGGNNVKGEGDEHACDNKRTTSNRSFLRKTLFVCAAVLVPIVIGGCLRGRTLSSRRQRMLKL